MFFFLKADGTVNERHGYGTRFKPKCMLQVLVGVIL